MSMDNLARKLDQAGVFQDVGTIVREEGPVFVVRTGSGDFRARRAVSCLVEPEVDDYVLVSGAPDGRAWVLAVLEREPGAGASLTADGDLRIKLPAGRFAVVAQEGVDLLSGKDVNVVSGEVKVSAVEGSVTLDRLSYLGSFVRAEVEKIKLAASTFDSVLDRISQKVRRSYRIVAEMDQLRAEQVDHEARQTMSLRARNTLVTAEELVKLDGEQIHLG
jgi:hypothetical protein